MKEYYRIYNYSSNTFWVTGYGVAGSIASEVGAKLTDKGAEVFCYTFGATNTGVGTKGTYINIKNVINEDDYIPKVANPNVYQRPGQIYSSSIKEDLMYEYREIVGNTNYKGDYYLSNYIGKVYNESLTEMSYDRLNQLLNEWSRHLVYYQSISKDLQENAETSNVALAINAMKEANKDAHSIKSYYVLAKSLNGFDLTDGDGEKIERFSQIHYLNTSSDQNITDDDYDDWWVKGRKDANGRYVIDGYSGYMRIEPSSNEKDIKAYYLIDGASDFGIDLPSGWSANIYARSFNPLLFYILMPDCINITSLYTKVLYKNDILENGKNEYEIRLHYTGSSVPSTPIYLAMQQHRDVTEKETGFVYGHIWESDDDSIYPTNRETCYKDKYFLPRDIALIYYMSLSGSEDPRLQELVARFIQGSINIASYVVDLEGLAEDIVDYSVKGFAGIVSKYDPSTAGIIKGSWVVAKNGYDLYGIRINPTSFVLGVLRDILNNLSDRIVNIINYKHDVGEAINVDSVIKEDGEKCIFNDYGLIDGTLINGYWKCESWGDQTYAYGEYGVKGDFRP